MISAVLSSSVYCIFFFFLAYAGPPGGSNSAVDIVAGCLLACLARSLRRFALFLRRADEGLRLGFDFLSSLVNASSASTSRWYSSTRGLSSLMRCLISCRRVFSNVCSFTLATQPHRYIRLTHCCCQ